MDVAAGIVHASVIPPFALSVIEMSAFYAVTPTVLKRTIIAVSVAVPLMMSSASDITVELVVVNGLIDYLYRPR